MIILNLKFYHLTINESVSDLTSSVIFYALSAPSIAFDTAVQEALDIFENAEDSVDFDVFFAEKMQTRGYLIVNEFESQMDLNLEP